MDLKRLEYFCSVAARGSISKAAKELHISQPPLSARIKELEEAFSDSEVATNSAKLQELHQEYEEKQKELEELYGKWEELMELE